jgi:hypothetical protein
MAEATSTVPRKHDSRKTMLEHDLLDNKVQNLLIFAKLLQGFPRGNVFPEKLKRDCKSAELGLPEQAKPTASRGAPAMASRSDHDDCRTLCGFLAHSRRRPFRRVSGHLKASRRIFPQILSRWFRIAGTFCRLRWFARYARSESLLCMQSPVSSLQAMSGLNSRMPSFLPC